ncbi:MAG: metallophosphoesterase family protein [Saprospiraceae bacterium]|nr:metallophosphoesterase family protein [Saprospiraceae bacterium]
MKIGILSDTHGYLDQKVFSYFENCDEIWHAGDIGDETVIDDLKAFKPCRIVFGNIDGHQIRKRVSEFLSFEILDKKILMIHIAGKYGSYTPQVRDLIALHQPDILVCGHSHILKIAFDSKYNLLYLNPGAVGISGFHQVRTILRFEISSGFMGNAEVIEFANRHVK